MYPKVKKFKLCILTTGGTIEKIYNLSEGKMENVGTNIKAYLKQTLKLPNTSVRVVEVMSKDSLDLVEKDRMIIVENIQEQLHKTDAIIVLHGTDTMVTSARYCKEKLSTKIPIVFTGAITPLQMTQNDASQNIIEALMAAKLLPQGIYISFHNTIFDPDTTEKDKEKLTFVAV